MPELPEGRVFTIGEKDFNFSVAETGQELTTGLKGVASLEPYVGMLFDFGCDFHPIMTPRGLLFPVEVAFIDSDGTIKEIQHLDPANGFTQAATVKVRYALEVPVGFFDTHNIQIGDLVNL